MNLNKTSIALAILSAFASSAANAISYDSTYAPSGNIDLSQYDNALIVNTTSNAAIATSNAFNLGLDKNIGKIELTGESGVFLAGGQGSSMTANTIAIKGTSKNNQGSKFLIPLF